MQNKLITLEPTAADEFSLLSEEQAPLEGTKRIQMRYGVRTSADLQGVEMQFTAPVQRMILTQKEARALSGMLRRAAAQCEPLKESPPPPIRSTKYARDVVTGE